MQLSSPWVAAADKEEANLKFMYVIRNINRPLCDSPINDRIYKLSTLTSDINVDVISIRHIRQVTRRYHFRDPHQWI